MTLKCPATKITRIKHTFDHITGADPGFFLGGGALVSCSTSTPINQEREATKPENGGSQYIPRAVGPSDVYGLKPTFEGFI